MQKYYDLSDYGNRNTQDFGTPYWIKGDLKITLRQQIELLVKLYKNSLPFSPQTVDKVKTMMIEEKTDLYILRGKTGWSDAYSPQVGWWIGYVEKADNAYFFALEIDMNKSEDAPKRKEITRKILKNLNII